MAHTVVEQAQAALPSAVATSIDSLAASLQTIASTFVPPDTINIDTTAIVAKMDELIRQVASTANEIATLRQEQAAQAQASINATVASNAAGANTVASAVSTVASNTVNPAYRPSIISSGYA